MPIKKNKINFEMNLSKQLDKIKDRKKRTQAKREVAEFVLKEIESSLNSQISPVTGEKFERLSDDYREFKMSKVGNKKANLKLKGDMIENLKSTIKRDSIEFKITDPLQKKKAFNHTTGDTLPRRPLLPDDEKRTGKYSNFDDTIKRGVKSIIDGYKD